MRLGADIIQEMEKTTKWVLLIAMLLHTVMAQDGCDFPKGDRGVCLPTEKCPDVQELIRMRNKPGIENILSMLTCGLSQQPEIRVCCPQVDKSSGNDIPIVTQSPYVLLAPTKEVKKERPYKPKTTTPPSMSRTTAIPVAQLLHAPQKKTQETVGNKYKRDGCNFPRGESGVCLPIDECIQARDLINVRNHPGVENILSMLTCGDFHEPDVRVCCPQVDTNIVNSIKVTKDDGPLTETQQPNEAEPVTTETPQRLRYTLPIFLSTTTDLDSQPLHIPILESQKTVDRKNSSLPKPGECGKPDPNQYSKIGRDHAAYGSWPWMAALGYESRFGLQYLYAGSLISDRYVLTSGRSVFIRNPVIVRLGVYDLHEDNPFKMDVMVCKVIIHEEFNPSTFLNDIALIKLQRPITYTDSIRPICLPQSNIMSKTYESGSLRVAGWGSQHTAKRTVLKEVVVPIISEEDCRQVFRVVEQSYVDSKVICAGYLDGGIDACRGDLGGPLMDKDNPNEVYLVGIVSYAARCILPGFPGVYTRVSSHLDWIMRTMDK